MKTVPFTRVLALWAAFGQWASKTNGLYRGTGHEELLDYNALTHYPENMASSESETSHFHDSQNSLYPYPTAIPSQWAQETAPHLSDGTFLPSEMATVPSGTASHSHLSVSADFDPPFARTHPSFSPYETSSTFSDHRH
ncbi:hypothetical protein O181_007692 [Austropuccinia psidii MF-1]|uniref:Uncharacterized protein n=1 Tax=Austropuccinia psidii MF-1 TaxID=1389203 RepID=A0A9Q3BMF3_9BASI|nr:hypothetical protein [Austropuccinia psidii MF-1]